jgi:hypothetical protein
MDLEPVYSSSSATVGLIDVLNELKTINAEALPKSLRVINYSIICYDYDEDDERTIKDTKQLGPVNTCKNAYFYENIYNWLTHSESAGYLDVYSDMACFIVCKEDYDMIMQRNLNLPPNFKWLHSFKVDSVLDLC